MSEQKIKAELFRPSRGEKYKLWQIRKLRIESLKINNLDPKILDDRLSARQNKLIPQFENKKPGEEMEVTILDFLGKKMLHVEIISAQGDAYRTIIHSSDIRPPRKDKRRNKRNSEDLITSGEKRKTS